MDRSSDRPPTAHSREYESDLIDVSERTALELLTSGDPTITQGVRRLLELRGEPRDVAMGFSNFLHVEIDRQPRVEGAENGQPNPSP